MAKSAGGATKAGDVQDLGDLDGGPVLLFGGAYSNLQALQAMLRVARDDLRIPPERTIHTGDVIAYCAQPRETAELLHSSRVHCLMGNCEESVGLGKLDCGCGFPEDSKCNEFSINWYAHSMRELKDSHQLREWMGRLPRRIDFRVAGRRLAVIHGSPRNISEFVWPSASDEDLLECFADLPDEVDGVVCGHSGIPFARLLPGSSLSSSRRRRMWLNAGVIGMPANDGTSRGWYALLQPGTSELEVSIRSLEFDAAMAAQAIKNCPSLNIGYADALLTGIWPSHEILPLEERLQTEMPLPDRKTLRWPKEGAARNDRGASSLAVMPVASAALLVAVAVALAGGAAALWVSRWRRCMARSTP